MSKLKDIRRAKQEAYRSRYSMGTIAQVLGVCRPTYRKIEEHPEKLTREQAEKLADYLDCDVEDIFL